jgi:hypothetical protein
LSLPVNPFSREPAIGAIMEDGQNECAIRRQTQLDHYSRMAYHRPLQADGQPESVLTATASIAGVPAVPEPGTLALLGIGLPLLGSCRLLRRRVV